MTISSYTIPAMAATSYKDSMASVVEDINGTDIKGNDTNQKKQSKYSEYSEDTTVSTDVYVTQKSTFSVVAPVVAVLNGKAEEKNTGDVRYKAFGNIASDEIIIVEPDETFKLSQAGKDDITCIVEAKNTITDFTYANGIRPDNAMTRDYTITANNMTAGSWHGSYNTNISLDTNPIPDGYTTLYEYDLSATDADNVKAYYAVPTKNTTPVEVETSSETANANLVSSITNLFTPITTYAADNNVIEYNGIRYELSDEDTLVISGTGEIKENVYGDLVDFTKIQDAVLEHFPDASIYDRNNAFIANRYNLVWSKNSIYPSECHCTISLNDQYTSTGIYEKEYLIDVIEYIDTIKDNYIVSLPKSIIINNGVRNISNSAFMNCTSLTDVIIPDSVKNIEDRAFYGCKNLTSVTIPNSVTHIGNYAFSNCTGFTEVTIPDSITSIDNYAFSYCTNLIEATIGKNVKDIGQYAFDRCTKLTKTYYKGTIDEWAEINFSNRESNPNYFSNNLYINDELVTDIVLTSAKKVNCYAFHHYNKLSTLTIETDVECGSTILYGPFDSCENLSKVNLNGLTKIANRMFSHCTSLTYVTIPDSVTSIGDSAFYGCKNLISVTIPNSVTSIGCYAFSDCTGLTEVTIPDSVTSIGNNAFTNLDSGSTIYCQSQAVADLLSGKYQTSKTTVVVDASKF